MASSVSAVIRRIRRLIGDETEDAVAGYRWTDAELLAWISEAQREIVSLKPEAFTKTDMVTVTAGVSRQKLVSANIVAHPSRTPYRLIRVEMNGEEAVCTPTYPTNTVDVPLTYDLQQTYTGVQTITPSGLAAVVPDGLVISGGRTRLTLTLVTTSNYFNRSAYGLQLSFKASDAVHTANGSATAFQVFAQEQQSAVKQFVLEYSRMGVTAAASMAGKSGWFAYGLMDNATRRDVARYCYRYEWRRHDSPLNSEDNVYVQAVKVYNGNILYSVHANETLSKVYEVDPDTGDVLRSFTSDTYTHISGISKSPAGDYYVVDFRELTNSKLVKINMESSLNSGSLVEIWNADLRPSDGSVEFFTHSGTNYFCVAQFSLSNLDQLTRVFPVSVLASGWSAASATPTKTWTNNGRTQGLRMYGGYMYESNNAAYDAANTDRTGCVFKLDIATFMTSGTTGADFTTFLVDAYPGPSGYPEELDFDADGRMYIGSESKRVFDDNLQGWSSVWSCPVAELGRPQENTITANFTFPSAGNVSADVYMNGRIFETFATTYSNATATQSAFIIGLPSTLSTSTEDYAAHFDGFVRRVHAQPAHIDTCTMKHVMNGETEPSTLTSHSVSLTNPDGELTTTGWTVEVGGLANRATNPNPHGGSSYFTGGNNVETLVRQRFDLLTVTGLADQTALDAAVLRGYVSWYQAAFSSTDDDARLGIRWLTSAPAQLSLNEADRSRPAEPLQWYKRHMAVYADSTARHVDVTMHMDRNGGTSNDGYVDDVQATIYRV